MGVIYIDSSTHFAAPGTICHMSNTEGITHDEDLRTETSLTFDWSLGMALILRPVTL